MRGLSRWETPDTGSSASERPVEELPPEGIEAGGIETHHRRLLLGGLAGTLVMTAITYGGPFLGLPNLDLAGVLGAMLPAEIGAPPVGAPELFTGAWWGGLVWHFLNGVLFFPLVYSVLFLPARRPGASALRGVSFGILLWLLLQGLVMPMMGGGFFSRFTSHPALVVLGSLMSHVGYGATLGSIARLRRTRFIEITQARAA